MTPSRPVVCIRGGGDLATGVAARLHRSGFAVVIAEIAQPLAVRRTVALAEAVYSGEAQVEELLGRQVEGPQAALKALAEGVIPVLVDPQLDCRDALQPAAIVDARMLKRPPARQEAEAFLIGLGPGFEGGDQLRRGRGDPSRAPSGPRVLEGVGPAGHRRSRSGDRL